MKSRLISNGQWAVKRVRSWLFPKSVGRILALIFGNFTSSMWTPNKNLIRKFDRIPASRPMEYRRRWASELPSTLNVSMTLSVRIPRTLNLKIYISWYNYRKKTDYFYKSWFCGFACLKQMKLRIPSSRWNNDAITKDYQWVWNRIHENRCSFSFELKFY